MKSEVFEALNKKKLFLFDFDGTIVDNQKILFEVLKRFFERYNQEFTMQTYYDLMGLTARQLCEKCCEICGLEVDYDRFVEEYKQLITDILAETKQQCFDYVKYLCENCKTQQFVLLSNNLTEFLAERLKVFGVYERFNEIIGCASFEKLTKEQVYDTVEERFNVKKEDCVLFEDLQKYIDAGKKVGFTTVGIEYWFNKGQLSADYIIDVDN